MALQHKTIDDFCRLCAIESQSGVIIYSSEGESLCLEEKIINCLRIEVSRDDMLPKKVCQLCSELLEDYHRFSERAVQVQQTLGLLLGLHAPHVPPDDMELCLMQANIKMESNLIKNELDELMIQQGNIPIEGGKFDLSVGAQVDDMYQDEEKRKKAILEHLGEREILLDKEDFVNPLNGLNDNAIIDNARQMHRRKMSQPKKAASGTVGLPGKIEGQSLEAEVDDLECFIAGANDDQNDFKSEDFNECHLFQDLDDEENNDENVEANDKEGEEEDSEVEKEWRKHWGILCDQCETTFPTKAAFDKHYRLYYNRKPVYTCSFCKKSADKYSAYRSHSFRHIYEGRFKCKFCDKKFCTKGMLQVHAMTHNGPDRPFVCEECGTGFSTRSRLTSHQKKHKAQVKKEFRCTECGKVLQTRGGLTAHLTVHKLGRRFMCHLCGKTFTQKINMQQHVKHHKGERPYTCEDCGKSFAEKSHLNRHKSFHTLDRPFQCPVCKKMYKTERCLKVHSHVHLNKRPYVCSYCEKGFLSSTKLKQHYNCHTGERPFACKYCERTFTNYPNWLKHTRRRHKVDHKTGLSLKEESQGCGAVANASANVAQLATTTTTAPEGGGGVDAGITGGGIEFIEMPEVEVKEDGGRDSVHSEHSILSAHAQHHHVPDLISQGMFAGQFHDAGNPMTEFHMHSVPQGMYAGSPQGMYTEPQQLTTCFRFNFKEIAQTDM